MVTFHVQNRFSLVTDVTIFILMKNYFCLFLLFLSSCSSNQEQKLQKNLHLFCYKISKNQTIQNE